MDAHDQGVFVGDNSLPFTGKELFSPEQLTGS